MKWTQLDFGAEQFFFQENYDVVSKFATCTWITHLWKFISDCGMELELPLLQSKYSTSQKHDFYLMDIIKNSDLSDMHKIIFNQVRLSLNIETASDIIVIGTGIDIHENILNGIPNGKSTKS